MKARYHLTEQDITEFVLHVSFNPKSRKGVYILTFLFSMPIMACVFLLGKPYAQVEILLFAVLVGWTFLTIRLAGVWKKMALKGAQKSFISNAEFEGEMSVELTPEAVLYQTLCGREVRLWKGIVKVEETANLILIFNSAQTAFVVAKRGFESDSDRYAFMEMLNSNVKLPLNPNISEHLIAE